jgi:serine/threonine protein kinase
MQYYCNTAVKDPETKTQYTAARIAVVASNRFELCDKLGSGSYGAVYEARDRHSSSNQLLAAKRFFDTPSTSPTVTAQGQSDQNQQEQPLQCQKALGTATKELGVSAQTLREISILRSIGSHPNVVQLLHIAHPVKNRAVSCNADAVVNHQKDEQKRSVQNTAEITPRTNAGDRYDKHMLLVLEKMDCSLHQLLNHREKKRKELWQQECTTTTTNPNANTSRKQQHLPLFTLTEIKDYAYQLLQGLAHIHSKMIIHRDIKPDNLLMDLAKNQLKITDFGLARQLLQPPGQVAAYSPKMQTLWYRSPELLLGCPQYSTAVDIWSAGCVILELLNEGPVFLALSEIPQLTSIFELLGTPTASLEEAFGLGTGTLAISKSLRKCHFTPVAKRPLSTLFPPLQNDLLFADLLDKMLCYNPLQRISALVALKHPCFASFHRCVNNQ